MFRSLVNLNCFSKWGVLRWLASNLLEKWYSCEIKCVEIDPSVLFAHHARGCTIVASKICENVTIFQNVTIGSNQKYNKLTRQWENIGNPIIAKNVVIADGAKVLGPIVIGENTFIAAGAIITKDIPAGRLAFGVNQHKEKGDVYDYAFNANMIDFEEILKENRRLIQKFGEKMSSSNEPADARGPRTPGV